MFDFNSYAITYPALDYVDPRAAVLSGLLLIITIIFINNLYILGVIVALCFILLLRNKTAVLRRIAAVNIFSVFIWLTLPLSVDNWMELGTLYTLRINASALIIMLFIAPLGVGALSNALIKLKFPPKLVSIMVLTYRGIYILRDRISASITAMQLRKPETMGTLRMWRVYANLFATAVVTALDRAERQQTSMILKGFNGSLPLTANSKWKLSDSFFVITIIFISTVLLCLN